MSPGEPTDHLDRRAHHPVLQFPVIEFGRAVLMGFYHCVLWWGVGVLAKAELIATRLRRSTATYLACTSRQSQLISLKCNSLVLEKQNMSAVAEFGKNRDAFFFVEEASFLFQEQFILHPFFILTLVCAFFLFFRAFFFLNSTVWCILFIFSDRSEHSFSLKHCRSAFFLFFRTGPSILFL